MKKKLLSLSVSLLFSSSAYLMIPGWMNGIESPNTSTAKSGEELQFEEIIEEELQCPLCLQMRKFPSEEYVDLILSRYTEKERNELIMTITTYDGDMIPGAYCCICGKRLPK